MKNLKDEVASWPFEEQPGEAELLRLLLERSTAQFLENKRQWDLEWLRKHGYLRDAS